MLNKTLTETIFQWEMEGVHQLTSIMDNFTFTLKAKHYYLRGYLALSRQLSTRKAIDNDVFFINFVKKDLVKKGFTPEIYRSEKALLDATKNVFNGYACELRDEILAYMDAINSVPFINMPESEISQTELKTYALAKLDFESLANASILLSMERYACRLFRQTDPIVENGFLGTLEDLIRQALVDGEILSELPKKMRHRCVGDYLTVHQKKTALDTRTNLENIQHYLRQCQSHKSTLDTLALPEGHIAFFDFNLLQRTVESAVLPNSDKVRVFALLIHDLEENQLTQMTQALHAPSQAQVYHLMRLYTSQAKLWASIKILLHHFYRGHLTQLTLMELGKTAMLSYHILHK